VHGGVEPGETAVRAAWREVREETGVTPLGFWELDYVECHYVPQQDAVRLVPCFAARFPEDARIRLGPEHDDHRWLPLEAALKLLLWRSQREALRILHETIARPLSQGKAVSPLLAIPEELYER
jgi:dATP pyrophosphohydrolase